MPLIFIADFIGGNKPIHIDAANGLNFQDPLSGNVHHFNQGHVIPANTITSFNNGNLQQQAIAVLPLAGAAVNLNIMVGGINIGNIHFINGCNIQHNGDVFVFAPGSQLNSYPGVNVGLNFDANGDMHIDEVAPIHFVVPVGQILDFDQ